GQSAAPAPRRRRAGAGLHQDRAQRRLRLLPAGGADRRPWVSPAADARWTRLLPRTLGARLVLVLLAGLLLAHALSFALLFHERAVATRSMMLANLERDAPVAVALLERVAPADRGTWLPRLERRTYRYLLRPARPGTELASDRAREVTDII